MQQKQPDQRFQTSLARYKTFAQYDEIVSLENSKKPAIDCQSLLLEPIRVGIASQARPKIKIMKN